MKHNKTRESSVDKTWFRELAGQEVDGAYTLEKYVGEGQIGFVYRAKSKTVHGRTVAVKLMPGTPRKGWETELRKVAQLDGVPGVVQLHGDGDARITHQGRTELFIYTVWQFVPPGRNLTQYLTTTTTTTVSFLMALIEQILRVLHACQKRDVKRHGDLKASNILIGDDDGAALDDDLQSRLPILVSDFGYGTTGGRTPKDDYAGLSEIANEVIARVRWETTTASDKSTLQQLRTLMAKLLPEPRSAERSSPFQILTAIRSIRENAARFLRPAIPRNEAIASEIERKGLSVGAFQVSEMIGDDWDAWKRLFVPTVPARSRILEKDITTVVTGPRGCGKTMLFRRLSERLVVECGPIDDKDDAKDLAGFYVNANDFADAFPFFPTNPNESDSRRLICFANLCILGDFLTVQSARSAKTSEDLATEILAELRRWVGIPSGAGSLVAGESELERLRARVEEIKWEFAARAATPVFSGFLELSQHTWLRRFALLARTRCAWMNSRRMLIFIDDYSLPRVPIAAQRILNLIFFQRSSDFVCKLSTEAAWTFLAVDQSGKQLQEGDDYQLIDIAEESLFMEEDERRAFLGDVFGKRLLLDSRVPLSGKSLLGLLGELGLSKTEFARRLRGMSDDISTPLIPAGTRRGKTKPKVLYHGSDVFSMLWSGDTRLMIQLVQDLVDEGVGAGGEPRLPLDPELQDRVYRNRGSQWLQAQARNRAGNPELVDTAISEIRGTKPDFALVGSNYGTHLKAVVEAFKDAARHLLLGPIYKIRNEKKSNSSSRETAGPTTRDVPRMAFRIEIVDDFRLTALATEVYVDLVRYGLFLRDGRGKSVRGAMVPRLYLRRLLLPYCTLALSKRDSVPLTCEWFVKLLEEPDVFKVTWPQYYDRNRDTSGRTLFSPAAADNIVDPSYDDTSDEGLSGKKHTS